MFKTTPLGWGQHKRSSTSLRLSVDRLDLGKPLSSSGSLVQPQDKADPMPLNNPFVSLRTTDRVLPMPIAPLSAQCRRGLCLGAFQRRYVIIVIDRFLEPQVPSHRTTFGTACPGQH